MNLWNLFGRSAPAYSRNRGVGGGLKGLAAIAVGRWLYKKWMSSRSQRQAVLRG
ncbi:MAG TPA: hypothetical protein VFO10_13415 [Oligoflexus sp.]|uniref:hypothetical protein n=1 Tax=Oligoflexus sp. TaxID=1971216 RepID=UPI002D7EAE1B|nr:hypothetical protein [Oligoflexus sp.]HET9238253.1 hypothetical protein [Oligoflexus sp.]